MCGVDTFTFVLLFVPLTVAVISYTMSHQPDTGVRAPLTPSLNLALIVGHEHVPFVPLLSVSLEKP